MKLIILAKNSELRFFDIMNFLIFQLFDCTIAILFVADKSVGFHWWQLSELQNKAPRGENHDRRSADNLHLYGEEQKEVLP